MVWEEISKYRSLQLFKAWCVVRNFNSIRSREERKSLMFVSDYSRETEGFNAFIEETKLVDN